MYYLCRYLFLALDCWFDWWVVGGCCSIKQPARIGVHEERKVASIVASEVRSKYRYQSENE